MSDMFGPDTPLSAYERFGGRAKFCRGTRMGVHVTFENGWTVSIQYGAMTYSGNHDARDFDCVEPSSTAEVACWFDPPGGPAHSHMAEWVDGDTVAGWMSWESVQRLLAAASAGALAEPIEVSRESAGV